MKPTAKNCPVCGHKLVVRYQTVYMIKRLVGGRYKHVVGGKRYKVRRTRRVCLGCNVAVVLHVHDRKKV